MNKNVDGIFGIITYVIIAILIHGFFYNTLAGIICGTIATLVIFYVFIGIASFLLGCIDAMYIRLKRSEG